MRPANINLGDMGNSYIVMVLDINALGGVQVPPCEYTCLLVMNYLVDMTGLFHELHLQLYIVGDEIALFAKSTN